MFYEDLVKKIKSKNCQLKWTKLEFDEKFKDLKSNIEIISSCGHLSSVQCSNFLYKNSCVICKQCTYKKSSETKTNVKFIGTEQEFHVMKAFKNYFTDKFDMKFMKEGCKVDFLIKPINIKEDSWLPIQLKTTKSNRHGLYSFHISQEYNNIIIFLFCIDEQKLWILDSSDINVKYINIGKNESIYNKYLVSVKNIKNILDELYKSKNNYLNNISFFETLNSIQMNNSIIMNDYRDNLFKDVSISYPEMNGLAYDCIINKSYKIQDKILTCHFHNKTNKPDEKRDFPNYICNIGRNSKKGLKSYQLGDNDFYWIHLPDKKGAYIIPEKILYDNSFISEKNETIKGKIISFFPYTDRNNDNKVISKYLWLNKYLYFYDNQNDMKLIINLFTPNNKNLVHEYECVCPIIIKE